MQCWGNNDQGQCEVACEDYWVAVAAGESHTCAIAADSTMRCWGSNTFGQVLVPAAANGAPLAYWTEVQVGSEHSCGIREFVSASSASVRELLCWGGNTHGQINVPKGNLTIQSCPPEFSTTPQLILERPYKYWNFGYASDARP
jgi:alpha-tubulin suppressor-like RCC1 family protein